MLETKNVRVKQRVQVIVCLKSWWSRLDYRGGLKFMQEHRWKPNIVPDIF